MTTYFEDLRIGQTASLGKTITEADILLYAAVSLDTNPVHLNDEVARKSVFGERIAHGMLSAGLISAVLGTRLPGPGAIYISQTLNFRAPVKIGDQVDVTVTVA
jgi:3-hydroxybutyryl-CoA dehydratase